jgi:hypothetical protein
VQGQTLSWDDTNKRWAPTPRILPDGTGDNQIPVWSATGAAWQPTDVKIPKAIADLDDVDDVIGNLGKDCVMVWDETAQVWTDSRSIEIDDIEFDASGPGTVLEGIAAYSDAGLDPTKDTWVPSCMAVDKYIRERINLEDLLDCNALSFATNGQMPVWNDTTSQWEPQDPSTASPIGPSTASPIIYLGTGAWNAANVTSIAANYGMATDAVPSPTDYPPLPGDQYMDLATGVVTSFTGAPGTTTPTTRTTSAIAGGDRRALDALIKNLGGLSDVTLSSASNKQILQYESATGQWKNVTPDFLSPTIISASDKQILQYESVTSKWKNVTPDFLSPTISNVSDKQLLQYEAATSLWKNVTPDFLSPTTGYTKAEVDGKLAAVMDGHPTQILSRKFTSGDLSAETFHNVRVKTKVGYLYVMDFGGTFHASHEDSLGYYSFRIDGGERAKYKVSSGRGYAQGGAYKYFIDGTGNDVDFSFINSWTTGVTWEFCWCLLTEIYWKP